MVFARFVGEGWEFSHGKGEVSASTEGIDWHTEGSGRHPPGPKPPDGFRAGREGMGAAG